MHRARPRRTSGLPSHPRRPLLHYETDRAGLARVRGGVSLELTACTWSRTCSGAWPWPGRVASFRVSLRELGGRRCRLDRVRCAIGGRHPSPSPTGPDFSARTLRLVGAGLLEPLVHARNVPRVTTGLQQLFAARKPGHGPARGGSYPAGLHGRGTGRRRTSPPGQEQPPMCHTAGPAPHGHTTDL